MRAEEKTVRRSVRLEVVLNTAEDDERKKRDPNCVAKKHAAAKAVGPHGVTAREALYAGVGGKEREVAERYKGAAPAMRLNNAASKGLGARKERQSLRATNMATRARGRVFASMCVHASM